MDTGDCSGSRSYCGTAPAANGAADDGAPRDATLRKGLGERRRDRKTKQKQHDQASFHFALLVNGFAAWFIENGTAPAEGQTGTWARKSIHYTQ